MTLLLCQAGLNIVQKTSQRDDTVAVPGWLEPRPEDKSKVCCAVISDNHSNMQRIPDDSSIFTAEAKAIDLALDFISTCDANN